MRPKHEIMTNLRLEDAASRNLAVLTEVLVDIRDLLAARESESNDFVMPPPKKLSATGDAQGVVCADPVECEQMRRRNLKLELRLAKVAEAINPRSDEGT